MNNDVEPAHTTEGAPLRGHSDRIWCYGESAEFSIHLSGGSVLWHEDVCQKKQQQKKNAATCSGEVEPDPTFEKNAA